MDTPSNPPPQQHPQEPEERERWRPSDLALNILTALVGLLTLAAGVGWLIRSWIVDLEVPYFAIPLVMALPVIVAVTFRNFWNDR